MIGTVGGDALRIADVLAVPVDELAAAHGAGLAVLMR